MSYQPILFYPMVFHIMDIPNFNKIQRGLVDYIYQQRRKDPGGEKVSNQGGWQSKHYEGENIVVTAMKEAISSYFYSNKILSNLFRKSLKKNKIDQNCLQFIENKNRNVVDFAIKFGNRTSEYLDYNEERYFNFYFTFLTGEKWFSNERK